MKYDLRTFDELPPEDKRKAIQSFKAIFGPLQIQLDTVAAQLLPAISALRSNNGEVSQEEAVKVAIKSIEVTDKVIDLLDKANTSPLESMLILCVALKSGIDCIIGVAGGAIKKSGMDWDA